MTDQEKNPFDGLVLIRPDPNQSHLDHNGGGVYMWEEDMAIEKNEVLARWRWKYLHTVAGNDSLFYFDEESGELKELPDFLHSLDAQAKWLWPKLTDTDLDLNLDDWATLWDAIETAVLSKLSPAEACAEAILSLIGEVDKGIVSVVD